MTTNPPPPPRPRPRHHLRHVQHRQPLRQGQRFGSTLISASALPVESVQPQPISRRKHTQIHDHSIHHNHESRPCGTLSRDRRKGSGKS